MSHSGREPLNSAQGALEPTAAAGDLLPWFHYLATGVGRASPARPPGPSLAVTCPRVSHGRTRRVSPSIPPAPLTATKPEDEATNTRTTILSLRQGPPLTRTQRLNAAEAAADSRATVGDDCREASRSRRSADESPAPPPRAERAVGWGRAAAEADGSCSFTGSRRDPALSSLQPASASRELINGTTN